jgi:hypothetical protein
MSMARVMGPLTARVLGREGTVGCCFLTVISRNCTERQWLATGTRNSQGARRGAGEVKVLLLH